jgi:plasmid stability protein
MSKKMISLEIPDNLREALRVKAFHDNTSISEVIRRILSEQLLADSVIRKGEISHETMNTTRTTRT